MNITMTQFFICVVIAFIITYSITKIVNMFNIVVIKQNDLKIGNEEVENVIKKCCAMFPKEAMEFKGEIYKRGAKVMIITKEMRVFTGKLIGVNNENIVCVMTTDHIIAQDLKNIIDMKMC